MQKNIQIRLNRINKLVSKAIQNDVKDFLIVIDTDKTRQYIIKKDGTRQEVNDLNEYGLNVNDPIKVNLIN